MTRLRPLALAAAGVVFVVLAGGARAQEGECRRWRDAFQSMPTQMVSVRADSKTLALRVKLAQTGEQQTAGFQCSTREEIQRNLILFDFRQEIVTQFHMNNVPAPLDIAFIKDDGRIFAILRMDPSPTALYGPLGAFRYALEARAGFYESQGIRQGDAWLIVPSTR